MTLKPIQKPGLLIGMSLMISLLLAALILFLGHGYRLQTIAAERFMPVPAVVESSTLQSYGGKGMPGTGGSKIRFLPKIVYTYEVDGKIHKSDMLYFLGRGFVGDDGQAEAQDLINNHPSGQRVEAWYDPLNPSIAVLDNSKPGLKAMSGLAPLVLVGFLSFAIFIYGCWSFFCTQAVLLRGDGKKRGPSAQAQPSASPSAAARPPAAKRPPGAAPRKRSDDAQGSPAAKSSSKTSSPKAPPSKPPSKTE